MKRHLLLGLVILVFTCSYAQLKWPSKSWSDAVNLSSVFPQKAVELSGLFWNDRTNRLYCAGDDGIVYFLKLNTDTKEYTMLGVTDNLGSPEGITQVNKDANEFYTIDEGAYEIRRYTHNSNFTGVTKSNSWKLLNTPMPDTGNIGPEGIAFVPDWYLQRINFISSLDGKPYSSKRGMGGLIFIAHQVEGYIWVYDVNPNVDNDLVYVGKYRTSRAESCDLSFDFSTGLLYILHNIDPNYLEVTDMKITFTDGEYKFNTVNEYYLSNPTGEINVEGLAISPKYPEAESKGAWLCRDVAFASETVDAIRWFTPYAADGTNLQTSLNELSESRLNVYPNPATTNLTIEAIAEGSIVSVYNLSGQRLKTVESASFPLVLNVKDLQPGIYFLGVKSGQQEFQYHKFIKN